MLSFVVFTLFACQRNDNTGFSSNAVSVNPNELGSVGSSSAGSSGGSSGDGSSSSGGGEDVTEGELAEADNEDSPLISGMDAFFNQDLGDVIDIHIYYSDAQDDLEGGTLALSYSNADGSGSDSISLDSSDSALLFEEGELTVHFENVDTALDYKFRVRMEDASGNQSNEYIAVAPSSE